jgi:hypothetical protein
MAISSIATLNATRTPLPPILARLRKMALAMWLRIAPAQTIQDFAT